MRKKKELCSNLGFSITDDLSKYLGVPLLHKCASKETYSYVVEKVIAKLSSWKVGCLSFAGRLTFLSSTAMAIPNYSLQTAVLPSNVFEEVERKCRNFIL